MFCSDIPTPGTNVLDGSGSSDSSTGKVTVGTFTRLPFSGKDKTMSSSMLMFLK